MHVFFYFCTICGQFRLFREGIRGPVRWRPRNAVIVVQFARIKLHYMLIHVLFGFLKESAGKVLCVPKDQSSVCPSIPAYMPKHPVCVPEDSSSVCPKVPA
ncbi:hypothetical protein EVAR_4020_1 [Eumeta japonica]|uniref:Uncharacterized protein n=1 Tax=Eumeta variegata TaxID=151549 RepID=A0A4C1T3Q8_EUMVA|nr:hypothetical protein EVAR_4020_1 [Eumeta japonica]